MPSPSPIAFTCPNCASRLQPGSGALNCPACRSEFAIRDGIFDLRSRRHDYYFNPVPRREMARLVRDAPAMSWDETVRGFLRFVRDVPAWIDNVAVNGRYSWKLFLDLPPDGRFLDFGCGLGNLTHNIAPHVAEVVALDLTWERLLFAQQRFARLNPEAQISLVASGDGAHLPFPDAYFDTIALSGVLEWMAEDPVYQAREGSPLHRAFTMAMTFFGETNPRRMQIRFLRELRRVLKPDGQLFIAIENRWNYEYFAGRPDHHSSLKYGSLLPRFAANLYSIAARRRPYRTYTYSLPGFRRLLRTAGLPHADCLGLAPGYSRLNEITLPAGVHALWKPRRAATTKDVVTRSPYFVPAFGMSARQTAVTPEPLIGRLLKSVEQQIPSLGRIELHTCRITGKDKVVFTGRAGGQGLILKIPAGVEGIAGEAHNQRVLERMRTNAAVASLIPAPTTNGTYQGLRYFIESEMPGHPLKHEWQTLTRGVAAEKVGTLLQTIHRDIPASVEIAGDGAVADALIATPLSRLLAAGLDPAEAVGLETRLRSVLAAQPWSLGFYHGDFSKNNIFARDGALTGLIDLEYAAVEGIPALDVIAYMESIQRLVDRLAGRPSNVSANLRRLAGWDWPSPEEKALLKGIYRAFAIDESLHPALCTLCWLQHISRQSETTARLDPAFMEKAVRPGLLSVS